MSLIAARQVADAVLYEGYLLYPYRADATKNQVRWQFGVLGPRGAAEAGVGEEPTMSCQVLLTAGGTVDVHLRFLQLQCRVTQRRYGESWRAVDVLEVDGTRWVPYHEATPHEVVLRDLPVDGTSQHPIVVPGGEEVEQLTADARLVRTRWPLSGRLTVTVRPGLDGRVRVVTLTVENTATWVPEPRGDWHPRDVTARHSFVGTHLLVTARGTRVLPLLDPPDWAAADAAACAQHRCWPALVAEDDGRDALLVAPIVLGDHPRVAPESAGDLFDATEIDEILTLRVRTLTDDEKAAARGTDPRAAAILDRSEALPEDALSALHGSRRDLRAGTRVLLRPARRADAQDLFLAGLVGVVARVERDLDGATHVAVTLEDDPGADLYGATGRFYWFRPDEVEVLA